VRAAQSVEAERIGDDILASSKPFGNQDGPARRLRPEGLARGAPAALQGAPRLMPFTPAQRAGIETLCRRFHVRRLDLFGSAARGADFDPARSDIDLLVEYETVHTPPALSEFLALREALEALLGRKVDLAMASAIRNPFVRASIAAARIPLHAA
jgi:uncharacterized protein